MIRRERLSRKVIRRIHRGNSYTPFMGWIVIAGLLTLVGCKEWPDRDFWKTPGMVRASEPELLSRADLLKDGEARLLRVNHQVGAQLTERIARSSKISGSVSGAISKAIDSRVSLTVTLESRVARVVNGTAQLESTIVGFKSNDASDSDLTSLSFSSERDAQGRVKTVDDGLEQILALPQWFELADRPVRPGDSWTAQTDLAFAPLMGLTLKLDMTATYVGDLMREGRRVAVIRVSVDIGGAGPFMASSTGFESGEMRATGHMAGVVLFDIEGGAVLESEFREKILVRAKLKSQEQSAYIRLASEGRIAYRANPKR